MLLKLNYNRIKKINKRALTYKKKILVKN